MRPNSNENDSSLSGNTTRPSKIPPDFNESLADLLPQLVLLLDADLEICYFNKRWSVFNNSQDFSSTPRMLHERLHTDQILQFEQMCAAVFENQQEQTMELSLKRHDGTFRWQSVTFAQIPGAHVPSAFLLLSFTDIHEQKTALLDNEILFRQSNDADLILDSNWNIVSADYKAGNPKGKSNEDLLLKNFWSFFPASVDSSLTYWAGLMRVRNLSENI